MDNINIVPDLGDFFKSDLNTNETNLLKNLKNEIQSALDFFIGNYMIDTSSFDEKITLCEKIGYSHIMKIKSYLTLLDIKDKNQTNKYEYERCIDHPMLKNLIIFLNFFDELKKDLVEDNIENLIDISKIKKDTPELLDDLMTNITTKNTNKKKSAMNSYTGFLNQLILHLCYIKEVLRNVHITSNMY